MPASRSRDFIKAAQGLARQIRNYDFDSYDVPRSLGFDPAYLRSGPQWYLPDTPRHRVLWYDMKRNELINWVLIGPVTALRQSASKKALLIKFGTMEEWIPKSVIHPTEGDVHQPHEQGALVLPEWLAKEKGWSVDGY